MKPPDHRGEGSPGRRTHDGPTMAMFERVIERALAREERRIARIYRSPESIGALVLGCLGLSTGIFALVVAAGGLAGVSNDRWYQPTYLVWDQARKARVPYASAPTGRTFYQVIQPRAELALLPEVGLVLGLIGLGLEWVRRERLSWVLVAATASCTLALLVMFGPLMVVWLLL